MFGMVDSDWTNEQKRHKAQQKRMSKRKQWETHITTKRKPSKRVMEMIELGSK